MQDRVRCTASFFHRSARKASVQQLPPRACRKSMMSVAGPRPYGPRETLRAPYQASGVAGLPGTTKSRVGADCVKFPSVSLPTTTCRVVSRVPWPLGSCFGTFRNQSTILWPCEQSPGSNEKACPRQEHPPAESPLQGAWGSSGRLKESSLQWYVLSSSGESGARHLRVRKHFPGA